MKTIIIISVCVFIAQPEPQHAHRHVHAKSSAGSTDAFTSSSQSSLSVPHQAGGVGVGGTLCSHAEVTSVHRRGRRLLFNKMFFYGAYLQILDQTVSITFRHHSFTTWTQPFLFPSQPHTHHLRVQATATDNWIVHTPALKVQCVRFRWKGSNGRNWT